MGRGGTKRFVTERSEVPFPFASAIVLALRKKTSLWAGLFGLGMRLVGATRIELATSRPPGVRATTAPSPAGMILP